MIDRTIEVPLWMIIITSVMFGFVVGFVCAYFSFNELSREKDKK